MEAINKRESWNKGKLVGQKPPLKPKDIWAIRIHLQNAHAVRDLEMFNLAIDSKLRGCDLVSLRVRDVTHGNQILHRAMVVQRKTQRPVQFELTEPTRAAVSAWLEKSRLRGDGFLFPSRSILKIVPSNCLTVLINAWPTQVKLSLLANVFIGIAYGITGCLLLWAAKVQIGH